MEGPLQLLPVQLVLHIFYKLHSLADVLALASTCSRLRCVFHNGRNREKILESVVGSPGDLGVLASISDSSWWIQGEQDCNYVLCAADYGQFSRKSISKHVLRDVRFICNSPRKPEFAGALHIFLSQFADLETRTPTSWKEGRAKILLSAAKYQQGLLAASEAIPVDFSRDEVLVALSLNCLCRTAGIGYVATMFPEIRDFDGPHKTIQSPRHGRGKQEDVLLPLIEIRKEARGWSPPTCSSDPGWNPDSSIGSALHHIAYRTRQLIFQGNPRDWPTIVYVLCILELFEDTMRGRGAWMRLLANAGRQLQAVIEDLSRAYYILEDSGQPFFHDWDRGEYARRVAGNQLAVEHFTELNRLWKAWFDCQNSEFHPDFEGLIGFPAIIRDFSRDHKQPVFAI